MEHINEFNIFQNLPNEWHVTEEDGKQFVKELESRYDEDPNNITINVENIGNKNVLILTILPLNTILLTYRCVIIITPNAVRMNLQYINKADNSLSHTMKYKAPRHEDEDSWIDTFYRLKYMTDQYYGNIEQYKEIEKKLKGAMHEMSYDHRTSGTGVTFEKGELISIV